jgi:DNA-binding MarR family transcriptional regulator
MGRTCAAMILRKAARSVTKIYDQALEPSSLNASQVTLLATLRALGPLDFADLARILQIDRSTLSRNLSVAAGRGLIRMEVGADRRTRQVSMTRAGARSLAAAYPLWLRAQEALEQRTKPGKLRQALSTARHLTAAANASEPQ